MDTQELKVSKGYLVAKNKTDIMEKVEYHTMDSWSGSKRLKVSKHYLKQQKVS